MVALMSGDRRNWLPYLPDQLIRLAPDFRWGMASSAFQAEGGTVPKDWVAAACARRVPPNPGNGFWERAEDDFRLIAGLGIRHYRLSIEWSRVEPERGRFDTAALDRYRAMCDGARFGRGCSSGSRILRGSGGTLDSEKRPLAQATFRDREAEARRIRPAEWLGSAGRT
jgi:hypothetical protein